VLSRFFQESDDLLALYARETSRNCSDRIARFQVIEKTLHRDASSGKNRIAAKNFRVLRYDAVHGRVACGCLGSARAVACSRARPAIANFDQCNDQQRSTNNE
jgi:hypothetical protein